MTLPPTVHALLVTAAERLQSVSDTPRLDSELLLAHTLGWSRARLLAERQQIVDQTQQDVFNTLVERRLNLEPVAYLVGHKEFYGLDFLVDRRVLVPRPETELLVERALDVARRETRDGRQETGDRRRETSEGQQPTTDNRPLTTDNRQPTTDNEPLRIADIGTGSGAIAVALAVHLPDAQIEAVDLSPDAVAVAAANVARHGVGDRVRLHHGDLLQPLGGNFDMIVSNPPYTILAEVDENVLRHEPHLALDGGVEGLDIYQRLFTEAAAKLRPDGALLVEIGAWQGQALLDLACQTFPGARVTLYQDLAGLDRVVEIIL